MMGGRTKHKTPVPNWNPYTKYVWTTSQVTAWIDEYGSWSFFDGCRWGLKTRKVFTGRYEVWFERL